MRKLYVGLCQKGLVESLLLISRNIVLSALLMSPLVGFSQATGDFQSHQTGNWSDVTTWERWNGTAWVTPAPNTPTSLDGVITIIDTHTVTVTANVIVDQLQWDNSEPFSGVSGSVIVNSGSTMTVNNGTGDDIRIINDFTDVGLLQINGTLSLSAGATLVNDDYGNIGLGSSPVSSDTYKVASGGTHIHTTGSPVDVVPSADWQTGSTCQINAAGAGVPSIDPSIVFYNFTWNGTAQSATLNLAGSVLNVTNDLMISGTNGQILQMSLATAYTLTIGRDFTIQGNSRIQLTSLGNPVVIGIGRDFTIASTSGVANAVSFDATGNIAITVARNFSRSNTGAVNLSLSSGTTSLSLVGNFSNAAGTLMSSATGVVTINFNGTTPQTFTNTGAISGKITYTVANSSILDLGTSALTGTGGLTLNPSSTLRVGSTDANGALQVGSGAGFGNIQVTGARTYDPTANIVFNGLAAQKTGTIPNVNLEIANVNGVTNNIVGTTNVVGSLTLTTGTFFIGASNTLNIQSSFITTGGGSLGGDPAGTSNLTFSGTGALGTLRFAAGSAFLNNLTNARTTDIVLGSDLNVKGNIALTNGNLDFSGFSLTMSGGGSITSGGSTGLKSTSTSNLVFSGSGYSGSVPFSGTSNQLNNLTISDPAGLFSWNSPVIINNTVTLTAGALTHTSGLTMAANSTFIKGGGTFTGIAPLTATPTSSYNVTYTGSGSTGLELPTNTTALNNLTISSGGTVTLAAASVTVNGNLSFSGGTFDAGSNAITVKGNLVSNASSLLTGSAITFAGTTIVSGSQSPTFGNVVISGTLTPSANFQINGNLTINGTMNAGSSTATFGGTTILSGTGVKSFSTIVIAGTLIAPTGTDFFNVSGDFTNNGTFTPGTGTVVFNGAGSNINGSATTNFANVTISGTLISPASLFVGRNFINNGTFTQGTGTVFLNGSSIQNISGTTVTNFNNITVTNVGGPPAVQVQSNQNIAGVLTLSANTIFDADGSANTSVFTLLSTSDGADYNGTVGADASVAVLPAGAVVQGNVTVQRFMSIEGPNSNRIYRYISSPVINAPVSQIQAYLPITGAFSGSSTCSGCTSNQSMFVYDETVAGGQDLGYTNFPVAANTETLAAGRGYALYERGNVVTSGLYAVTGNINSGAIAYPLTFTSTSGGTANDGWNLIGNPYPSTIDWDAASGWTRSSDITGAIYMTDNAAGTPPSYVTLVASYVGGSGGVGVNGGSNKIASGQAFFVKSDGTGTPAMSSNENVKIAGTQAIFFRTAPQNILRAKLVQNGITDEIAIRFVTDATDAFDKASDAYKLKNSTFNLSTTSGNVKYAINSLGDLSCTRIVKMSVDDVTPGSYSLNFSQIESFTSGIKILFHDAKGDGSWIDLTTKNSYDFDVTSDTTTFGANRFSLSFGYDTQLPTSLSATSSGLCTTSDSQVTVANSSTTLNYFVRSNGIAVSPVMAGTGKDLALVVSKSLLAFGANAVEIVAQSPACSTLTYSQDITVTVDSVYNIKTSTGGKSCLAGAMTLGATGAPANGSYNWYSGTTDTTPLASGSSYTTPEIEKSKIYYVAAVNSVGCEGARVPVTATVVNYNPATISVTADNQFTSNYATGNRWLLNDELLSDTTSTLKATTNGTYKLLVNVNGCATSDERVFSITGIGEVTHGISGYPNPVGTGSGIYTLEVPDPANEVSEVAISNSLGIKIGTMQMNNTGTVKKGQYDFSTQPSGFYFVKVATGTKVTVIKIIKK